MYWAEIAVSVDGKAVALVDKGGYLWGGTSDFKVICLFIALCIMLSPNNAMYCGCTQSCMENELIHP